MSTDVPTDSRPLFSPLRREEVVSARIVGWVAFVLSLLTYWLTVAPSASYWDCPEYILSAVRLEVGHPPGNPFWTLFHRVATIPFGPHRAALAINMASGLFTALAVALLARMVCVLAGRVPLRGRRVSRAGAMAAGLTAAMMFGWCDSAWYSAVEAEVYAMSLFFTSLTLWLMLRWATLLPGPAASRLLLLTAYLTGLSLGVHQLNLLSLPVLALVYLWKRAPGRVSAGNVLVVISLSFGAIVCVLKGMMPGTVWTAACFELFAVNTVHLPFGSGVAIYLLMLALVSVLLLWLLGGPAPLTTLRRVATAVALFVFLLLSSFFLFGGRGKLSLILAGAVTWTLLLSPSWRPSLHKVRMGAWGAVLMLVGYSSLLLIPIRSAASPYINTGFPSDPFTLYSYIEREQYGGAPLLYGRTPYSRPMYLEEFGRDSLPVYRRYALRKEHPVWSRAVKGGRLSPRSGFVTSADSVRSARRMASGRDAYVLADYRYSRVTTPELDMWFPRITSGDPSDIAAYRSWIGMDTANMTRVAVTEALDSAGRAVNRLGADGERAPKWSHRPTYLQNLEYFLGYQVGYMYFRYLLWNFSGRQNDITSSGEADHGNFLTGIPPADDAMLGAQSLLPGEARECNRGHNIYWMLPLLLCLYGAVVLTVSGRSGRRVSFAILMLFLLTGIAIVVYLNQTVGEPRERDYTFLGSYFAFAAWGGFGAARIVSLFRRRYLKFLAAACVFGVPSLMLARNYDDHDRSRRDAATDFACNILESLPPETILFTDGDNYTFPLWYVQEVLGVRRDVTVVSMAYLALPRYVASLRQPGEEAMPVPMTGRSADLLYGRYALTPLPAMSADTCVPDASEFLRRLYSSSSPSSRLPASKVRMTIGGDTVVIDLRAVVAEGGGSMLTQRQLAILDIIATNSSLKSPRPICWFAGLAPRSYSGFMPYTESGLFVRTLRGGEIPVLPAHEVVRSMRWGGFSGARPPYADPTVQGIVSGQRAALVREGRRRLDGGHADDALVFARAAADSLPASASPFVGTALDGKNVRDGVELALLLIEAGNAVGDSIAVERGRAMLAGEITRIGEWRRWRDSLAPRQRHAVSFKTLRLINIDTDSLALRGGIPLPVK